MTEITAEVRPSATTTTVMDNKNGSILHSSAKGPRKSVTEDLVSTFSSPTAWILVIALIVTWSAVAVVMFDLVDYRGYIASNTQYCDDPCLPPGSHHHGFSKTLQGAESPRGGIHEFSSDPMKVIDEVVEESTDWIHGVVSMLSDMISPDDDDDDDDDEKGDTEHPLKRKAHTVIKKVKDAKESKARDEKKAPPKEVRRPKIEKKEERVKREQKPEKKVEKAKKEVKAVEKAKSKAKPKEEKPVKKEPKDQFEFCRYVVDMYTHEDVSAGFKSSIVPDPPKGNSTIKKPAGSFVEGLKAAVSPTSSEGNSSRNSAAPVVKESKPAVTPAPNKGTPTTKKTVAPIVEEKRPVAKSKEEKKDEPKKKPSREEKKTAEATKTSTKHLRKAEPKVEESAPPKETVEKKPEAKPKAAQHTEETPPKIVTGSHQSKLEKVEEKDAKPEKVVKREEKLSTIKVSKVKKEQTKRKKTEISKEKARPPPLKHEPVVAKEKARTLTPKKGTEVAKEKPRPSPPKKESEVAKEKAHLKKVSEVKKEDKLSKGIDQESEKQKTKPASSAEKKESEAVKVEKPAKQESKAAKVEKPAQQALNALPCHLRSLYAHHEEKAKEIVHTAEAKLTKSLHPPKEHPPVKAPSTQREAINQEKETPSAKSEHLVEAPETGKHTEVDKKPAKEEKVKEKDLKTSKPTKADNEDPRKGKSSMRYFQCVFVDGNNGQHPIYPFTALQSPSLNPKAAEKKSRSPGH
nr:PREDICTED: triadin isoform X4 [Lepisosteus oculatus]